MPATPLAPATPAAPAAVASITVSPFPALMRAGDTLIAIATLRDSAGNTLTRRNVTWTSSNQDVAAVTDGGVISGVGAGSATIIAHSGSVSAGGTVTVYAPVVTSLELTPASDTLLTFRVVLLSVTALDQQRRLIVNPPDVTWSSTDPAVASVDSAGRVTGVSPGSVIVTATIGGVSANAAFTVLLGPTPPGIDGDWIMTLSASPSCRDQLPEIARERQYLVHFTQQGSTFRLTISSPTLVAANPGEDGGSMIGFDIQFILIGDTNYGSWTSTDLHDHLSATETLDFDGAVSGALSGSIITATMSGDLEYWNGIPSSNGPTVVCRATDHVVTLHR